MNKEIEFRGWKKEGGGWIFGDLLFHSNYRNGKFPTISNELVIRPIEVVPESVGQYTGLSDLDGRRVYVGDVLYGRNNSSNLHMTVKFGIYRDYDAGFYVEFDGDYRYRQDLGFWLSPDTEGRVRAYVNSNIARENNYWRQ